MRRGRLYVFKGDGSYLVDIAGTRVKITRRKAGDIHWSTRGAIDRTGQPSSTMRRRPSGSESGTDGRWRTATEPAKEQRTEQSGFSWTEQEDRMSHGITMTAARRRVVAAIESGTVRTVRTGTRDGNIVRDLVNAGVLTAIRTYIPAEITYHGRRIPQAVVYSRIKVAR